MSMFNINAVFLAGNVTKDAELKSTKSGKSVVKFTLATNESVKKGDEWESVPTFHDIIVWGKLGEAVVDRLIKGAKCTLQGRIVKRNWEHEGKKYYATEVVADKVVVSGEAKRVVKREDVEEAMDQDTLAQDISNDIPF